jgi:hypothetical protein
MQVRIFFIRKRTWFFIVFALIPIGFITQVIIFHPQSPKAQEISLKQRPKVKVPCDSAWCKLIFFPLKNGNAAIFDTSYAESTASKKIAIPIQNPTPAATGSGGVSSSTPTPTPTSTSTTTFYTAIDTMKDSRDTGTHQLTDAQIANDVNLVATLNVNYITVDVFYDYPDYMQSWINAVRATGKHIWFRAHWNQWENNNGTTGIMTPSTYNTNTQNFILAHPSFFQSGDIFDPDDEPEEGKYWKATYGTNWTTSPPAPNTATREYNSYIRDSMDLADAAFAQIGVSGVITNIHSLTYFNASTRGVLEAATVAKMGNVTIDTYPDADTTDPTTAANLRLNELKTVYSLWHVPIIYGEMGYSNDIQVDDATQEAVLKAEFDAISTIPYLQGLNYWVGAGGAGFGGYTNIFSGSRGNWSLRPAANDLAAFFKVKVP